MAGWLFVCVCGGGGLCVCVGGGGGAARVCVCVWGGGVLLATFKLDAVEGDVWIICSGR